MTRDRLRVVVAGAGGKMGQALIEGVLADASLQLAAALDAGGSPAVGRKVGGTKVSSDVRKAVAAGDVLIDFTRPEGTIAHLEACARAGKSIVIGTTGISEPLRKAILQAARRIPIALSPNYAVGVKHIHQKRRAEHEAYLLAGHAQLELRDHLLREIVALLDRHAIRLEPGDLGHDFGRLAGGQQRRHAER